MSILTNDMDWPIGSNSLENEKNYSTSPKLRSILRKNRSHNIEENCTEIDDKEKDSDYTGDDDDDDDDEEENESPISHVSIKKKNQTRERHCHQSEEKNQVLQVLSSSINSQQSRRTIKADSIINNQFSTRAISVTFTDEQPTINQRNISTLPTQDFHSDKHFSINMNENSSSIINENLSDYRPVYVSPLKYRPLIGLSANDNRLLLEKRVSLLGKPLIFHPIQKRSLFYRRTQLRIYNFLERADGYKAIIYHTFV